MVNTSDFHDVRFPVDVAFGASGGPERSTEIITLGSGQEQRNQRWANSRRRYDAGYGVKSLDKLHEVIAFFEARRGPLYGFRFRDPTDFKSCPPSLQPANMDQEIGTGDGSQTQFQLVKHYGTGAQVYRRAIALPVDATVLVALNGSPQDLGSDFTIDTTSGLISFASAPSFDAAINAGFEFDVPVRFDTDQLVANLATFSAGEVPSVPLIEVRV